MGGHRQPDAAGDFQAVTGAEIDGTLTASGLTMRVGGAQAAKGTLRLHRGRLTGTLGGRKIDTSLGPVQGNAAALQLRLPRHFPAFGH